MLTDIVHSYCQTTNYQLFVYGFFRFPEYSKERTWEVTGQQRMFTPPWHLPLSLLEVRECPAPVLYFIGFLILNTVGYIMSLRVMLTKILT